MVFGCQPVIKRDHDSWHGTRESTTNGVVGPVIGAEISKPSPVEKHNHGKEEVGRRRRSGGDEEAKPEVPSGVHGDIKSGDPLNWSGVSRVSVDAEYAEEGAVNGAVMTSGDGGYGAYDFDCNASSPREGWR